MALLLNRKYGSRLECLYYILCSCYSKFGTSVPFSLKDLKFDEDDEYNVHNYCNLLIQCVGYNCCRFLNNPLDSSKCYATQSLESDSTKSKAISDVGGSLVALGFITPINSRNYKITESGERWVNSDFESEEWCNIARQGALSYGVLIGFLNKLRNLNDEFNYTGIYLSYPQTEEQVEFVCEDGVTRIINLSTDSRRDSNTRTITKIIGWCVTTGILIPKTRNNINTAYNLPQLRFRDFVNLDELTVRNYEKTDICRNIFNNKPYVSNPLSFKRLHKNVGSIRENGSDDLRNATLLNIPKILKRRYVFVKVLNYCSINNLELDFNALVNIMTRYEEHFFSPGNNYFEIMESESEIADITGIPFEINNKGLLVPLTILNEEVLDEDVDDNTKRLVDIIIGELFNDI